MNGHSVEKIGGTSMSNYAAVRDNIILRPDNEESLYQRIFVVSAYGGVTDQLLDDKKTGHPGVFSLFANGVDDDSWKDTLYRLRKRVHGINQDLFPDGESLHRANQFIDRRLDDAEQCLSDLHRVCGHGHFSLEDHLETVKEMLASIGEAHSAWNTASLLQLEGINARFIDLTGWDSEDDVSLDERVLSAFEDMDLDRELPVVTGYTHSNPGLMSSFDRGYSEMTFSRLAVLTRAREAVIHKEFHLCSADPLLVGKDKAVPIGRTNYNVADQLSNLGMEAIHPKAARGLWQHDIPLRVKNTFEPEHAGTLITGDYRSYEPCVEIIAGCKGVFAIELFDQNMATNIEYYDQEILGVIRRFRGQVISKDTNANTITHYLKTNLKTVKRICRTLEETFAEAEVKQREVAIVSAIGSDMQVQGILAKTVGVLADNGISALAVHKSMQQVDMQFIVDEEDYSQAVKCLHECLVEIHDHGPAICLAS